MQRSHRILVAAVQAASLVGCATTDFISPGQVARLDGYDTQVAPAAVKPVETLDGHRMWFNGETSLTLDSANQKTGGRFASIRVKDDVFVGKTTDGREVQVPLSAVRSAKVEQPSSMLTLVIMSYALGTIAAGTLALYALKESRIGSVDGRALRVNGKVVTAPLGRSQDWSGGHQPELSGLSSAARAALALHWHQTALAEHASVPAFSRLSLTLMALGAPGRLVDAAHRAAREEIQHARIAFSLASAYGGTEVAPGPLTELANAPAITATSLRALAAESLIDGCLMEGFGAAVIEAGRVRTADRPLRAVLAAIAREEASHARPRHRRLVHRGRGRAALRRADVTDRKYSDAGRPARARSGARERAGSSRLHLGGGVATAIPAGACDSHRAAGAPRRTARGGSGLAPPAPQGFGAGGCLCASSSRSLTLIVSASVASSLTISSTPASISFSSALFLALMVPMRASRSACRERASWMISSTFISSDSSVVVMTIATSSGFCSVGSARISWMARSMPNRLGGGVGLAAGLLTTFAFPARPYCN